MNIYEMYFSSSYFRNIVDNYVILHRTSYVGAFKCMEIIDAYKKHLHHLSNKSLREYMN